MPCIRAQKTDLFLDQEITTAMIFPKVRAYRTVSLTSLSVKQKATVGEKRKSRRTNV
jgi:hypothetical protein